MIIFHFESKGELARRVHIVNLGIVYFLCPSHLLCRYNFQRSLTYFVLLIFGSIMFIDLSMNSNNWK